MENKAPLWTLLFGIGALIIGIIQFRKELKKNGKKIFPLSDDSIMPFNALKGPIILIVLGLAFCINYISNL